ncbi:MAG: flagellar basal body rod protein FlgB [Peptococcaceae bacterium]|nr:flagellar basal body rod protein FlgB [Peptococcaceae bacterium]
MFFQSNEFKVMEAGVQAAWMQQKLHLQNIANLETPGYKAKGLVFEDALKEARGKRDSSSDGSVVRAEIVTQENTVVRPDGNNVDFDSENVSLYKAYVQYSLLLDKITGQFSNYSYVLNSNMK